MSAHQESRALGLPAPGFFTREELVAFLDREIAVRKDHEGTPNDTAMLRAIRHTIEQVIR